MNRIWGDSQRKIRAISVNRAKSRTLLDCRRAIVKFSSGGRIRIIWVPGHSGIAGNEMANALAIGGRELEAVNLTNVKPLEATKAELKANALAIGGRKLEAVNLTNVKPLEATKVE